MLLYIPINRTANAIYVYMYQMALLAPMLHHYSIKIIEVCTLCHVVLATNSCLRQRFRAARQVQVAVETPLWTLKIQESSQKTQGSPKQAKHGT